ncbi:hypothetical protein ACFSO7_15340 [Bacillus sp. CGMCC 1.16607]|uniref:hypothetical protein n=1 Tax=Bacillus sp. CGMCC 1.16607 TaxID=3351842 RepID=UPI00362E5394
MNFNSYWYLGLGSISLFLLFYVLYKKRNKPVILLFLAMVGVGYIIEGVIYNFLHSYQYFPKIIKSNLVYDSAVGAIASNALALPVAATFIAALRKNWFWIFALIGLFAGIEWLFLKLQIYSHNWWRTEYTALGLPFYFMTAKWIYQKILQPLKDVKHFIILFLIIGPIAASFNFTPIMLFSNRYYQLGWFDNIYLDTTAFSAIYYLAACLLYIVLAKTNWRYSWLKYVISVVCIYSANHLLKKLDILHSLVWWDIWYYLLLSIVILKITIFISRRLSFRSC